MALVSATSAFPSSLYSLFSSDAIVLARLMMIKNDMYAVPLSKAKDGLLQKHSSKHGGKRILYHTFQDNRSFATNVCSNQSLSSLKALCRWNMHMDEKWTTDLSAKNKAIEGTPHKWTLHHKCSSWITEELQLLSYIPHIEEFREGTQTLLVTVSYWAKFSSKKSAVTSKYLTCSTEYQVDDGRIFLQTLLFRKLVSDNTLWI